MFLSLRKSESPPHHLLLLKVFSGIVRGTAKTAAAVKSKYVGGGGGMGGAAARVSAGGLDNSGLNKACLSTRDLCLEKKRKELV